METKHFDVFNGDADGLCALHQLRLAAPRTATIITGTKREIDLLRRVSASSGDSATVLDVSLDTNRESLLRLLAAGASVDYFDHHFAGDIPSHPKLNAVIDPSPSICTSMIVDRLLGGIHRAWAVVGAFGDNLERQAYRLAGSLNLSRERADELRELGESLNYNAYGDSERDLFIAPHDLFAVLRAYADPFELIRREPLARTISQGRRHDLDLAQQVEPEVSLASGSIYVLPDAAWSRRVRGVFANELASGLPHLAHAILSPNAQGGYTVSVRAPIETMRGADLLCRRFESGSGRSAAAGINNLAPVDLPEFVRAFEQVFGTQSPA